MNLFKKVLIKWTNPQDTARLEFKHIGYLTYTIRFVDENGKECVPPKNTVYYYHFYENGVGQRKCNHEVYYYYGRRISQEPTPETTPAYNEHVVPWLGGGPAPTSLKSTVKEKGNVIR